MNSQVYVSNYDILYAIEVKGTLSNKSNTKVCFD